MKTFSLIIFSFLLCLALQASDQGFVAFKFKLEKPYFNGPDSTKDETQVKSLPGLADFSISTKPSTTIISWTWHQNIKDVLSMGYPVSGLPAGEYHLLATWDSQAGFFNMYLNGLPMRKAGTQVQTWKMPKIEFGSDSDVATTHGHTFIKHSQVKSHVPKHLYGQNAQILGAGIKSSPLNVSKDQLLYKSSMQDSESLKGWRMEGPIVKKFVDGACQLSSEFPNAPKPGAHIVYWAPQPFPANFVAEWEVKVESKNGLNIVFFAAQGVNGKDIFDESIKKRDGVFHKYTRSDINCYHISYYADNPILLPGRIASNLRKNSGFYLVNNGSMGIETGNQAYHKMTLIKSANRIQMLVDGRVFMDYTGEEKKYGPLLGGGHIGLRQMQWSSCSYRNFKVWSLK